MINLKLADQMGFHYRNSYPFPHIVIDNFLENKFANLAYEDLKKFDWWDYDPSDYSKDAQVNKFFCPSPNYQDDVEIMKRDSNYAYQALHFLNSDITLKFLEKLTGIQNLIPDPTFTGGGYHKIKNGGKLAIHADYNVHPQTKLHRRINLLVYLNPDWQEEWGGHLELWDKTLTHKTHSIAPLFNRAVIFNITDEAYHGHPEPINCPEDQARYSFALYYFTEDRPEQEKNFEHSALWFYPENKETQTGSGTELNDIFELTNE
jgi:Rps23 Pro-64 3,4-dihydroxylase Tpa1-like proline 4-hydroxylase